MSVDVTINGRAWKVALEAADEPGRFVVTVKGKRRVVNTTWVDGTTLSLLDDVRAYEIRLHARGSNGAVGVEVGGILYEASVARRGRAQFSDSIAGKIAPDAVSVASIKAPMPGRVVRVLVSTGDRVSARQGVVVVEAMKMENELRAPRDGIVKDVLVAPGAAVESGAVLLVVGD